MNSLQLHQDFQLNGESFSNLSNLLDLAQEFIKSEASYLKDLGSFILDWFDEKSYVLVSTSGTTGVSKEIELQKFHMIASAKATGRFFNLENKNSALLCLPAAYIAGKMMFVRAMVLGLHLDVVSPSSSPFKNLKDKTYDFVAVVPLQIENSLKALQKIRVLLIGGAKLEDSLRKKINALNLSAYETYGMTETVTHIAVKKTTEEYFCALPTVALSLDSRGCLKIDAPKVSSQSIQTNDLVVLKANNKFKWLGRIDNVINSGGVKLFPEQIEQKLAPFITSQFFITGKPDTRLGEKLVLLVESAPYEFDENIFSNLAVYEKPKEIQFVSEFKRTPTGKILRKENLK